MKLIMATGLACRVDMVLVGAEGVVESGGVINKLGTYQAALAAHAHNTPFYVAAESYKVAPPPPAHHAHTTAWSLVAACMTMQKAKAEPLLSSGRY